MKLNQIKLRPAIHSIECSYCGKTSDGIKIDNYLWPNWMAKDNCLKCPPRGPRLFNFDLMQCWHCSIEKGNTWHR